jgi:hypothetical protein
MRGAPWAAEGGDKWTAGVENASFFDPIIIIKE